MKLYDYPKSSASYRVRIACHLKNIPFTKETVDLVSGGLRKADYLDVAPAGLVPTLVDDSGLTLSQSLAIIQYLDAQCPEPRLVPVDPAKAARAWELALDVACDIHPLNNLRVLKYVKNDLGAGEEAKNLWYAHWIQTGFAGLEVKVAANGGQYCMGDAVTLPDLCLVPQMFNARRFDVELSAFPTLVAVDARLRALPAFAAAAPE